MPLWLALAIAAAMGVPIGIGLGARRTKRKYPWTSDQADGGIQCPPLTGSGPR